MKKLAVQLFVLASMVVSFVAPVIACGGGGN